jgi:hypothetical protein
MSVLLYVLVRVVHTVSNCTQFQYYLAGKLRAIFRRSLQQNHQTKPTQQATSDIRLLFCTDLGVLHTLLKAI